MNSTIPATRTLSQAHVPSVSLFAQLLASERLTVRVDRSLTTAAFMPEQRVLLLPSWSGFDEAAWLLFVAHEVGHALFTPEDSLTTHPEFTRLVKTYGANTVRTVTNVIEDIRIERMIREKYRGLSGVFSRGYHSLINRNFFGFAPTELTDVEWAKKSALDRMNIYAKAGALYRRSLLHAQEIAWYNRALTLNTYDEVLVLVEEVIKTLSDEQKSQMSKGESGTSSESKSAPSPESGDEASNDEQSGDADGADSDADADAKGDDAESKSSSPTTDDGEDTEDGETNASAEAESATDGDSDDAVNPPSDSENAGGSGAVDPFNVASQEAASQALEESVSQQTGSAVTVLPSDTRFLHHNDVTMEQMLEHWEAAPEIRDVLLRAVNQQRREQSPILASMIAAFRANQSAWQSRRVQVSRSGALDTTKLAQYKLVDDLFLRRRSLPEAQNHGFVIHVDWSGSMTSHMATVLWQVLHLVWFAESIRVPVSVYAFSNSGAETTAYTEYRKTCTHGSPQTGRLLELYRSNAAAPRKQDAQAFLLGLALSYAGLVQVMNYMVGPNYQVSQIDNYFEDRAPRTLVPVAKQVAESLRGTAADVLYPAFSHMYAQLGGTPLYYALFASVDTVRKFRQVNRVEQCVSVWLTDGSDTDMLPTEDVSVPSNSSDRYRYDRGTVGNNVSTLVDPRSGRTFMVRDQRMLATLFDLHRTLTGATVICVDITPIPLASLKRVLNRSELGIAATMVGEPQYDQYGRRSRHTRGIPRPKVVRQTRKRVVLPVSDGSFTETGLLLASRKQFPTIGCDAYLVSHPDWWMSADKGAAAITSAAKNVLKRSNDADDEALFGGADDASTPVKLNAALLAQHANVAMRRFADLLVPYMAAGRDDATV